MKKRLHVLLVLIFTISITYFSIFYQSQAEKLRGKHRTFLKNSPFKKTKRLSKEERKNQSLPPNAYYEQKWELSMDPNTGRPMPERLFKIQDELREERLTNRGGTGDNFNPWIDRGPNNIGGRTRGIMYDPNDNTNKRVFAGGVSGGLWVNNDITDSNSSWALVPGIGANISVTSIISDPNNSNTFYIGSGESYTSGDAIGRGIWKSTDGGVTWTNIFGGPDGTISSSGQIVDGVFYVNDIIARNNAGSTELYASIAGAFYASSSNTNHNQWHGLNNQGLYKSVDNGANWNRISIMEINGSQSNPNDLELDINNNIWLTTTRSSFGFDGGKIFRSTNGNTFTLVHTIANAKRTELEPSQTDANKFWVAANVNDEADLYRTTNSFTSVVKLNEPNDADNNIPPTDYTRGQAFYDLPIEADSNDRLYVGGIDLFVSTNDGDSWSQISKWSNNNNLATLDVPLVHADQHAIVFDPTNNLKVIFGTDGGVYYSSNVSLAGSNENAITSRNKDYNVTQFYYGSISPGTSNEILYGGTQDNGTLTSQNSVSGVNNFDNYFAQISGDGSFSHIDQDGGGVTNRGEYMIVGSTYLRYHFIETSITSSSQLFTLGYSIVSHTGQGNFINEAELDDVGNILYANTSTSTVNRFSAFTLGENSATRNDITNVVHLTNEPSSFKISPFDNTTMLVGTRDSKLLKVENLNASPSFSDISGSGFVGSISDIEYGTTAQEFFVTFHNYGVASIWHTSDGGSNWRIIEGNLPDLPVKCILQNPLLTSELIIGTDLGVWRTNDYTAPIPQWTQAYNGMSDVSVLDLDLRIADNTVLATTHGRGLFTSQFTGNVASIDDVLTDKKVFTVYPTVSGGEFSLYAKNELGQSQIQIFDINGKKVYSSTLDFNRNRNQSVSTNLKSGIYIVNVIDENGRKSSEKIIIQ